MRLLVAALLCGPLLLSSPASGDPTFPYRTVVAADDVYVRSGPGQNYYPTDKLKRGAEVEVYRHDPGGWCAIRPVDGSFTWVSSRFLKPTEDNLAVVTEEGVQARVGSQFSDIRDVVQVRLQKGEVVELLDRPPRAGAGRKRLGARSPRPRASSAGFRPSISMPIIPATACASAVGPTRAAPARATKVAAAVAPDDSTGAGDSGRGDGGDGSRAERGGRRFAPREIDAVAVALGRGVPSGVGSHRIGAFA